MSRDNDHTGAPAGEKAHGNSGKRSKYRNSGRDSAVHWDSAEARLVLAAINAVTEAGDALVFARSSDGGVLSITVCSGQSRVKYYPHDGGEADKHLAEIYEDASGHPYAP